MAVALVQKATPVNPNAVSGSISFTTPTTIGNLIVVVLAWQGVAASGLTVSGGGSYVSSGGCSVTVSAVTSFAYAYSAICTAQNTNVLFSNATTIQRVYAYEFRGVNGYGANIYEGISNGSQSAVVALGATISPAEVNELIFNYTVVTGTLPSGYTALDSGTNTVTVGTSYLVDAVKGNQVTGIGTGPGALGFAWFQPKAVGFSRRWLSI